MPARDRLAHEIMSTKFIPIFTAMIQGFPEKFPRISPSISSFKGFNNLGIVPEHPLFPLSVV